MVNYCDRVFHDRKMEKDSSEWRSKIGNLLMAGYNGIDPEERSHQTHFGGRGWWRERQVSQNTDLIWEHPFRITTKQRTDSGSRCLLVWWSSEEKDDNDEGATSKRQVTSSDDSLEKKRRKKRVLQKPKRGNVYCFMQTDTNFFSFSDFFKFQDIIMGFHLLELLGLRQTISEDSSPDPSTLLPENQIVQLLIIDRSSSFPKLGDSQRCHDDPNSSCKIKQAQANLPRCFKTKSE
ncbi:hypothetical protein RND71_009261 [Anisodus tanguticus]|uniref:Uncharacterized protein n=1 Tax=Anisodus tanguticus TaxID=243964 RepID=A0AAE1SJA1_9SOLA|nr:hypothetical protein RND71_009261 [Anisodus tanguticus]